MDQFELRCCVVHISYFRGRLSWRTSALGSLFSSSSMTKNATLLFYLSRFKHKYPCFYFKYTMWILLPPLDITHCAYRAPLGTPCTLQDFYRRILNMFVTYRPLLLRPSERVGPDEITLNALWKTWKSNVTSSANIRQSSLTLISRNYPAVFTRLQLATESRMWLGEVPQCNKAQW